VDTIQIAFHSSNTPGLLCTVSCPAATAAAAASPAGCGAAHLQPRHKAHLLNLWLFSFCCSNRGCGCGCVTCRLWRCHPSAQTQAIFCSAARSTRYPLLTCIWLSLNLFCSDLVLQQPRLRLRHLQAVALHTFINYTKCIPTGCCCCFAAAATAAAAASPAGCGAAHPSA
jgi:hypothetical protein